MRKKENDISEQNDDGIDALLEAARKDGSADDADTAADSTAESYGQDTDAIAAAANAEEPISSAAKELRRFVEEQAREDERPKSNEFTFRKILGGEFLTARLFKDHIWLILICLGFVILYVSNRYACDRQRIEINRLEKDLQEARYRAMSSSSKLTRTSRQGNVLDVLRQNKDSVLHIPSQPPYIINVPNSDKDE